MKDNPRRTFLKRAGQAALGLGAWSALDREAGAAPPWPPTGKRDGEDFWQMVRLQYPVMHNRIYLNTGGLGPASFPVLDAEHRTAMALQAVSEHGHRRIEEARAPVAAFLGVRPEEIAFMRNATEGNATIASGLGLRAGDEVIFESHAHPGGSIPWLSRQKADGIQVKIFEPDPTSAAGNLERIERLITPRTRVVQVSHVTAPTGIRFPVRDIARLAHDRGLWFHVDGAQSAGMFPFDVREIGCDSYATSGHKWIGAPHGTGILYVREERLGEVVPTETGAYSDAGYELPDRFTFNPTAQRYEPGTRDAASVVGIVAALGFLGEVGMERVGTRGQELARYLQAGLREIPGVTVLTPEDPGLSASITTYKTDRVPYDELFRFFLEAYDARTRVVTERGLDGLRVSTHLFNLKEDCDLIIEGTREILAKAK